MPTGAQEGAQAALEATMAERVVMFCERESRV
jgi:hypothetical protein